MHLNPRSIPTPNLTYTKVKTLMTQLITTVQMMTMGIQTDKIML